MSMSTVATTAILIARGCPTHALNTAHDWLSRQLPADTPTGCLTQVDEAITIATALTEQAG